MKLTLNEYQGRQKKYNSMEFDVPKRLSNLNIYPEIYINKYFNISRKKKTSIFLLKDSNDHTFSIF